MALEANNLSTLTGVIRNKKSEAFSILEKQVKNSIE
jgi:hypothetical protein